MLNKKFLFDALERGLSTAAEAAILAFGANQVNVVSADWKTVGGFAVGGFVLAVLKSIAARGVGNDNSGALLPKSDQ